MDRERVTEYCFFFRASEMFMSFSSGGRKVLKPSTSLFHSIDDFVPFCAVCLIPDIQKDTFKSSNRRYIIKFESYHSYLLLIEPIFFRVAE